MYSTRARAGVGTRDLGGTGHPRLAEVVVPVWRWIWSELLADGSLILRQQLGHPGCMMLSRVAEGVGQVAGVERARCNSSP